MDNLYGPSRQETCISCLHELLQTIFNDALFALYTVLIVIICSNYVADIRFALTDYYCYSPLFLTVLVRTTYQLKIFACFPFLRIVILPMFVEYRTRQVLNLARFVIPFCIYSLYMLSPCKCNILRHEVPEYFQSTLSVPNIVLTANLNSLGQSNFVFEWKFCHHSGFRIIVLYQVFPYYSYTTHSSPNFSVSYYPFRIYRP